MLRKRLISAAVIPFASAASMALAARTEVSPSTEPHFVTLPEVVVPIIDGERISGRLLFDIVIDAVDASAATRLALAMPRLRSASISAGIEFSRLQVSGLTAVDAELLSRELTVALRHENPDIARVLIVRVGAAAG